LKIVDFGSVAEAAWRTSADLKSEIKYLKLSPQLSAGAVAFD
jgi:hypothetical protein